MKIFILTPLLLLTTLLGNGQNVGIGTALPAAKLHIASTDTAMLRLENTTTLAAGVSNGLYFKAGSWFTGAIKQTGITVNTSRTGFFGFASTTTSGLKEYMSITDAGNVGIGTTTPALAGLTVNKKTGAVNAIFGDDTTGISIESASPGIGFNSYYGISGRRFIQNGFGGVIGFDPTAGSFVVGASATAGIGGATATIPPLMTILSNGNVGMGTNAPGTPLTVFSAGYGIEQTNGTISVKSYIGGTYGGIGTTTNHPLELYANNQGNQFFLMPSGVVGIGSANAALGGLVVDKSIGAVNAMFGSSTTGISIESSNPGIGFNSYYGVAGRKYIQSGYGGVIGFDPAAGSFVFGSTAASGSAGASASIPALMTILANGNVGIGNTSPSTRLRINTATNAYGFTHTDGTATIGTFVGTPSGGTLGGWIGTQTNHPLYFCTGGVSQMTLATDGTLGLNNTLGLYNTHNVAGTNYGVDISVAGAGSNKTGIYTEAYGTNSIGLSAYGDTYAVYGNGGTWSGYFIGSVFATTYQTSDEKLKTNIAAYPDALTAIAALPVKTYDYLQDGVYKTMRLPQGRQVGIMAQDIEKQFPQLVKKTVNQVPDEKTHRPSEQTIEFKAVNYTGLIPVLVKGMQEQQQEIEELKAEIAELKTMVKHS